MPAPKSVVKINNKGVTYTSSVDKAQYFVFELTRAALRDVGKFVVKNFKTMFYNEFHKTTGNVGKGTKYKVFSGKSTTHPRVQVGIGGAGFYGAFQELGTSKMKKYGFLSRAAEENIAEIVKIESQYLSALEDEAKALELIDEEEMIGGEDE